ncbi:S-adenosyl-L-methionine-dependent tRNA 4-demethylwyosine synthase TYW1B, partial [Frankliniella fusca]
GRTQNTSRTLGEGGGVSVGCDVRVIGRGGGVSGSVTSLFRKLRKPGLQRAAALWRGHRGRGCGGAVWRPHLKIICKNVLEYM